jgi:hypothetical protein
MEGLFWFKITHLFWHWIPSLWLLMWVSYHLVVGLPLLLELGQFLLLYWNQYWLDNEYSLCDHMGFVPRLGVGDWLKLVHWYNGLVNFCFSSKFFNQFIRGTSVDITFLRFKRWLFCLSGQIFWLVNCISLVPSLESTYLFSWSELVWLLTARFTNGR